MAYIPRRSSPTTSDALARLQILLPALAFSAALAVVWRVGRRTPRQSSLLTLDSWNMSGLDRPAEPAPAKRFPASTYDAESTASSGQ